jgi:hypothetical protein
MTCYVDFFVRYCPNCGKHLTWKQERPSDPHEDFLEGTTVSCSCGTECQYFPEHLFPYVEGNESTAFV